MGLSGSLRTISLDEIIQTLGRSQATGVLSLTAAAGARHVVFADGQVIRVVHEDVQEGASLVERLIALEAISLDQAGLAEGSGGYATVAALESCPGVERDAVRSALERIHQDDVIDLFTWDQASFSFREADDGDDPLAVAMVANATAYPIPVAVSTLLMESARRLDEWSLISADLPDGTRVPFIYEDRDAELRATASAYPDALVIDAIDGVRSIDQVVADSPVSSIDANSVLHRLLVGGYVSLFRTEQLTAHGQQLLEAGDPERAATVLRHALAAEPANASALGLLGNALESVGDGREAARCFAQVSASALKLGQADVALRAARRSAELDVAPEFRLTLVMVLVETGDHPAAVAELHILAEWLMSEHRYGEAKTTCLKILQLAPDDQPARRMLSRVYAAGGGDGDQHLAVCVACGATNPREAEVCGECSAPLNLSCLSCGRVVAVSDRLCIFCGADPHRDPDGERSLSRGPHTSAVINPERLRESLGKDADEGAAAVREQLAAAREREESGDLHGALDLWRSLASEQGGEAVANHIRELESFIHDSSVAASIERANRLRHARRFWSAARAYKKAQRAISERDPRHARLTNLIAVSRRSHTRAASIYGIAFGLLGVIAWLVVEPLFQRQAIHDQLNDLEGRIAIASLAMGASSWNGLIAEAEELRASAQHAGLALRTRADALDEQVQQARGRLLSAGLNRIRSDLSQDDMAAAAAAITALVTVLPQAEPEVAEFRAVIAERQAAAAAAEAALAAAPEALAAAEAAFAAGQLPTALEAFEVLRKSPVTEIAERAEIASAELRSRREQIEGALAAVNRQLDDDLVGARDAVAQLQSSATTWGMQPTVDALEQRIRSALGAAETAWRQLSAQSEPAAIQAFIDVHSAAPQVPAARELLAEVAARGERRAAELANYAQLRAADNAEAAWRAAQRLLATYPDVSADLELPLWVSTGVPGARLEHAGEVVAEAGDSGVIHWWRPAQHKAEVSIQASGYDAQPISVDDQGSDWQMVRTLQRALLWEERIPVRTQRIIPHSLGWLIEGGNRIVAIDADGGVQWTIDKGDATTGGSDARLRVEADGQILITRHDGSLVLVNASGGQELIAQPEHVPVGQPGLFTNELIGGQRLAVISERLLLGRPDALEPVAINQTAIQGPALRTDGLDTLLVAGLIDGSLVGVDGSTREVRWNLPLAAADIGPLQWLNKRRLVTALDGTRLVWLDMPGFDTPRQVAEAVVQGGLVGDPWVDANGVVIADRDRLRQFSPDGEELPAISLLAPAQSAPVRNNTTIAVAVSDGRRHHVVVYRDGRQLWQRQSTTPVAAVMLHAGNVIAACEDGTILALDLE